MATDAALDKLIAELEADASGQPEVADALSHLMAARRDLTQLADRLVYEESLKDAG